MSHPSPTILALDFDGVICDGLIEYFQTTKRTYEKIWNADEKPVSDELEPTFHRLRTVIETGWEMPILLRALILGIAEEKILQNWLSVANQIVESERLDKKEISKTLDTVRDEWIASDLDNWLALHRFYPGVLQRIGQILASSTKLYIVTTKEGRFVKQLLQQQKIDLLENRIYGKEYKRPKYETLREILKIHSEDPTNVWFVEDRLEALELVRQQADLEAVKLYLAEWGYNTQQTRDSLRDRPDIKLLSLQQFEQDFSSWH
jgi:phosphoglycolate phosphatase-like HAD superfamily hydrolase